MKARSLYSEQRKLVPAAIDGETLESDEDYRLYYDQRESSLDNGAEMRRTVGRLAPHKEPASRARQSEMWMKEMFHPLAESVNGYERELQLAVREPRQTCLLSRGNCSKRL